jgi:hypothetical protein
MISKAIVGKMSKIQEIRDFPNCPGAKERTLTLYQNKRPNMVAARDVLEYAKIHLPILLGTHTSVRRKQPPREVHRFR